MQSHPLRRMRVNDVMWTQGGCRGGKCVCNKGVPITNNVLPSDGGLDDESLVRYFFFAALQLPLNKNQRTKTGEAW